MSSSPQPTDSAVRTTLHEALASVHPLVTMERDGLVLTALTASNGHPPQYLTFEEAAAGGAVQVHELGSGSVPTVEAVTHDQAVVLFAGDTIVGGKQNRVINITVWLGAAKATQLPVTCLEHGRWSPDASARFGAGRKMDYALRSMLNQQVSEQSRAVPATGAPAHSRYVADQGAVWAEIARKEERSGARSSTAALHDLYERDADALGSLVAAFPCPAAATGLAVGIGGRIAAVELFDAPRTLTKVWPRLVEGAASAHIDHRRSVAAGFEPAPRHRYPDPEAIQRLLERAQSSLASALVAPSVGEGSDVRLVGPRVAGSALVRDGRLVHAELFRIAPVS